MFILGTIQGIIERGIKRMRSMLKLLLPICIMAFVTGCGAESTVEEPGTMEESARLSEEMPETETPDTDTPMPQDQTSDETYYRNRFANPIIEHGEKSASSYEAYSVDTEIAEVTADPVFGDFGRLIFPVDSWYYSGSTLGSLSLTWYNNIDPDKTVEIANYLRDHAESGDTVFYDIYSEEEKAADPDKEDTGLFFFRGNPGEKFAVCNAGGGFAYVGAMHDSFPYALELSKMGYNAFALIYRPGAQTACEDLARAISFIFEHAEELEVDTDCYSLWGGSAGARMAAYLGSYGTAAFGGDDLPQAGAVIMQYTGHSEYNAEDPPTYACVGTNDGIANWRTMEARLAAMEKLGTPTQFHAYQGLRHGFGLGTGTVAEGWIDDAVAFWEAQMD